MDTLDNENKDINNSGNANSWNSNTWDDKENSNQWFASDDSSTHGRDKKSDEEIKKEEDKKKDDSWSDDDSDDKKSDDKSKDTKEKSKEDGNIPPSTWKGTKEDWEAFRTEQDAKFQKQSSSFQRSITQAHEKLLTAETKAVEASPARLIELAESENDKDVKLAKQIAKNLYSTSLNKALKELNDAKKEAWDDENDEEKEARIRREIRREESSKMIKKSFISNKSILDKSSDDFDEDIKNTFDWYFDRLKWDEQIITNDELEEILENAYFLSTKWLKDKQKEKDLKKSTNKVATAWSWSSNKKSWKKVDSSIFDWMPKSD